MSGAAGRPISGSPKSHRHPPGHGARSSRQVRAPQPIAQQSPTISLSPTASLRPRTTGKAASGPFATHGAGRRRICTLHGSRSSSMLRWMRRPLGPPCTKCCAIARAMSCSTIWGCVKIRRGSSCVPTAQTFHISCALISHSRWACRSGIRNARAAEVASRRGATSGGTL